MSYTRHRPPRQNPPGPLRGGPPRRHRHSPAAASGACSTRSGTNRERTGTSGPSLRNSSGECRPQRSGRVDRWAAHGFRRAQDKLQKLVDPAHRAHREFARDVAPKRVSSWSSFPRGTTATVSPRRRAAGSFCPTPATGTTYPDSVISPAPRAEDLNHRRGPVGQERADAQHPGIAFPPEQFHAHHYLLSELGAGTAKPRRIPNRQRGVSPRTASAGPAERRSTARDRRYEGRPRPCYT